MIAAGKSEIYFFFEVDCTLRDRSALKQFITSIFKSEGKPLEQLNYIFCSDKRLLNINRQFLKHDFYTDIVTFELSHAKAPVNGEVYISVPRVRDNAAQLGTSFREELHRVIFHGALHLCGFRDKKPVEKTKMRFKENYYLAEYFG